MSERRNGHQANLMKRQGRKSVRVCTQVTFKEEVIGQICATENTEWHCIAVVSGVLQLDRKKPVTRALGGVRSHGSGLAP